MLGTTFTHPCIEGVNRLILNYQEKVRTATEKTNKELRYVAKNYKTKLRKGLDNFEEEPLIDINLSNISFELDALSKKQETLKATQKNEAVKNFLKFKQDLFEELSIPESTQRQTPYTIINQIPEILNILVARYTMEIMQIESKKKEDLENVIEEYKKAMESSLQKIGNESPGSTKLSETTNFLENISERQKEIKSSSQKQVDEKISKFKEEIINEIFGQDIAQIEEERVAMEEETVATERERVAMERETVATERERVAMEEETVATEEETCELDTENMPSIFIDDDGNIKESGQELKLLNDKFVFRENDDDLDFVGIKNEDRVEFQDELPEELLNLLDLNDDEEGNTKESDEEYITENELHINTIKHSKILECLIKKEDKIISTKNSYRSVLIDIWKSMPKQKILDTSTFKFKSTNENGEKGYYWNDDIHMSFQNKNALGTLKEIINMIKVNELNIKLKIKLQTSRMVFLKMV